MGFLLRQEVHLDRLKPKQNTTNTHLLAEKGLEASALYANLEPHSQQYHPYLSQTYTLNKTLKVRTHQL